MSANLIPEGKWRARGVSAEYGWSSHDNQQIGVELELSPDQDVDVDGRYITWYGTFTDKAAKLTLKALRALGVGDDISDLSTIDANEVEVVVGHEPDLEGVMRARVRFINVIGAGGVAMKNKMLPHQIAELAARMRGQAMAASQPAASPKPAPTTASKAAPAPRNRATAAATKAAASSGMVGGVQAQPPADDDIPFLHNDSEAWGEESERWTAKHTARRII